MRKISFVIAAAALILTASVGGWVASTTAHDRAAGVQNIRGGTPVSGGLFVMPPVVPRHRGFELFQVGLIWRRALDRRDAFWRGLFRL